MRILIDTTVLVEAERQAYDLDRWIEARGDIEGIFVCDAGIAEWLAEEPVRDEGKRQRFRRYWEQYLSLMPSLPLSREVCERAGSLMFLADQTPHRASRRCFAWRSRGLGRLDGIDT